MTAPRGLATILGAALAFGLVGGMIGAGLGSVAPGYYRFVFRVPDDENDADFSPVELGAGLGVTQGTRGGAALGVVLVGILAWKETRPARPGAGGEVG